MPLRFRIPVRFADVDHAGIVYYPRFFHYFHIAFEEFFFRHLGRRYVDVVVKGKLGFPAVHAQAEFHAPVRFGQTLNVDMTVTRIGSSSISFGYVGRLGRRVAVTGDVTVVCVDMNTFRSRTIPKPLRGALEQYKA